MNRIEAIKYIHKNNLVHPRCACCKAIYCGNDCSNQVDEELIQLVMEGKLDNYETLDSKR